MPFPYLGTGNAIVSTTGNSLSPNLRNNAGIAFGISSATNTNPANGAILTQIFTEMSGARPHGRNAPYAKSIAGVTNSTGILSVSGYAYNNQSFIISSYSRNVNGQANNAMSMGGATNLEPPHRNIKQKAIGARTVSAMVLGYWNPVGILNQRSNWSTSPVANTGEFQSSTSTGSPSDEAIYVTYKSIPGELTYQTGDLTPTTGNYPAKNS